VNLKSIGCEGMDLTPSIHLAQDKTLWLALVFMVMSICVPEKVGNFLTKWATTVSASHEGLCSMDLLSIFNKRQTICASLQCNVFTTDWWCQQLTCISIKWTS
jgi:hypothetical protein